MTYPELAPSEAKQPLSDTALRVIQVLDYIEEVQKMAEKTERTVSSDPFCAYEHEIVSLPEISTNRVINGDDVWLSIPRLADIPAPDLPSELAQWVTLFKGPDRTPEIRPEITVLGGSKEPRRLTIDQHPEIRALFDWYSEVMWLPWAEVERVRRRVMAIYSKLFKLHRQLTNESGDQPLEFVWGIGMAIWSHPEIKETIRYPILLQICDLTLNTRTYDLEVRPKAVPPKLKLGCFEGMADGHSIATLEREWRQMLEASVRQPNPFEADSFSDTLGRVASKLDSQGRCIAGDIGNPLPTPSTNLVISHRWVIFVRKRSADLFIEDIQNLRTQISNGAEIPEVVAKFVKEGADEAIHAPPLSFRGLSSSEGWENAEDLYFPLPYNNEQVAIARQLAYREGVVVQGPPGTGKTHTIGNVISHYLAQGKRVLVTAKTEKALSELQSKLPPEIRKLSVALLSNERDGKQQFESSVHAIASGIAALNKDEAERQLKADVEQLDALHRTISECDQKISQLAGQHMVRHKFRGEEFTAHEIAQKVLEDAETHAWFDDSVSHIHDADESLSDEEIDSLRRSRIVIGKDLSYRTATVPDGKTLAAGADFLNVHRDLKKARAIEDRLSSGSLLPLLDETPETFRCVETLNKFLERRNQLRSRIGSNSELWIVKAFQRLRAMTPSEPVFLTLKETLAMFEKLDVERRRLRQHLIQVPPGVECQKDFRLAVERQLLGKSPFALPFGNSDARAALKQVLILGQPPNQIEHWQHIEDELRWRLDASSALLRWNALKDEFELPIHDGNITDAYLKVTDWCSTVRDLHILVFEYDQRIEAVVAPVFGAVVVQHCRKQGEAFIKTLQGHLQTHIDRRRLEYARRNQAEWVNQLQSASGEIVQRALSMLRNLGSEAVDESNLVLHWDELRQEMTRLHALRVEFVTVDAVAQRIHIAGGVKWAERLRSIEATNEADPQMPSSWRAAWRWRRAERFLTSIDGQQLLKVHQQRRIATKSLSNTYQALVAHKAWLALKSKTHENVLQYLQAYLTAILKMPKGKGVRTAQLQRDAKSAMDKAYPAVPCWILPFWRIAEAIPAKLSLFDLVVIDEASQLDIWAMPALLRAKKLLVVGDDKQVSPSTVGILQRDIDLLRDRFLTGLPHAANMTVGSSIYDLASVLFASSLVKLKEHFRCVPALIEFSKARFYDHEIHPLRLPSAADRLDPPLIDVFVKGGNRQGEINKPEAEAITQRIVDIIGDPQYTGRSIGVVTMVGQKQAALIQDLVSQAVSVADHVARNIQIGNPPSFQGSERDIMLLSMVIGPGENGPADSKEMRQRVNVAMSRARDRMILFRSFHETDHRAETLTGMILKHFKQPFAQDVSKAKKLRELCESDFEFEMYDLLVERGYRVRPQVRSGPYRIDFVVEGSEGRRLAIECDGDKYHGPDRWREDMLRQRVLERAGWRFWRCFGSDFTRRRTEVLDDLWQTLRTQGIEPIGAEEADNTNWTKYEEVPLCLVQAEMDPAPT